MTDKEIALNWSGGPAAHFLFNEVGPVLQVVIRDEDDPDLFRVLFDGYKLAISSTQKKNEVTIMIVNPAKIKRSVALIDRDPRFTASQGRLESVLYERDGSIFYHRFDDAPNIVIMRKNQKSIGLLTGPVIYSERGFES